MEGEQSTISIRGDTINKNNRPVLIINVVCKLFMMVLREREREREGEREGE